MPLVSVIVTTFNREELLKATIASICNQTFQDYELIIVDNFSNYDFFKYIDTIKNITIKSFQNNNYGSIAFNRNFGLKHASGKYIAFLDDDDLWLPEKLEKQIAILEKNIDYGLVHTCCDVIDENGKLKNVIIGRPGTPDVKHGDVSLRMMGNWTIMMPTPLLRKEVIDRVGFFNEEIPAGLEDVEFWVRCSFEAKFYYIDESLAQYRVHSGNISGNSAKYIELPLYLKRVFTEVYVKEKISKRDYERCIYNLCQMQLKMIEFNFFKTIKYVFELNAFWFLKMNNNKLLIKMLFFK